MPIYRPKSINNLIAALTAVTLTVTGLALFQDRLWVKSDTNSNIVQVGNAGDSVRYMTVSATATTLQGISNTTSLMVGKSTDNGNSVIIAGDNAYFGGGTNKALLLLAPGSLAGIYLNVNGLNRFYVGPNGDASLGYFSPNARLEVSANAYTYNLFEINNRNTSGVYDRKYFTVSTTSTQISNAVHFTGVVVTTNTTYTVSSTDTVIIMRGTVARTVTLPTCAAANIGRKLYIEDGGQTGATANVTINRAGSDTINGATSATINSNGGVQRPFCAASGTWFLL